jgi:hypothetical protein
MDTLLVILSLLTVAAQQALADGRDWRPVLAMPELFRKRHPHAPMILAQLHDDRQELALVRALPATPEQEPYLCAHMWLVVPVADLPKYKKELELALIELRAEFEEISSDEQLETARMRGDLDDDDEEELDDDDTTDQPV